MKEASKTHWAGHPEKKTPGGSGDFSNKHARGNRAKHKTSNKTTKTKQDVLFQTTHDMCALFARHPAHRRCRKGLGNPVPQPRERERQRERKKRNQSTTPAAVQDERMGTKKIVA